MSAQQITEDTISQHTVAIFSKSYCPYCRRAKATIAGLDLPEGSVQILELDERNDGGDIQAYLLEKTGQRTVPNIFINKQHVGGNDNLQEANTNGKLQELLKLTA